jgi:hypothetical protein
MVLRWLIQVLHPTQKSERQQFFNGWSYGIKEHGVQATFNGMISLLNVLKAVKWFRSYYERTYRQTA